MWPRSLLRRSTVSRFQGTHRDRNRQGRIRQRPRLEILEERQLLSTAAFLGIDTTTQGSWKGTYAADGYGIVNNATSYPSYAEVTTSKTTPYAWNTTTTDVRGLQKATQGASDRIAACWYGSDFFVNTNLTDGQTHQVSLYAVDWDTTARRDAFDVVDASTKAILDTETISGFHGGKYLTWNVTGNVQFHITKTAGANAVVSGLFFASPLVAAIQRLRPLTNVPPWHSRPRLQADPAAIVTPGTSRITGLTARPVKPYPTRSQTREHTPSGSR